MKKSMRIIGIMLIIIAMIFAFVNTGLLKFNYFTLLSNGTAEFQSDAFIKKDVKQLNLNMSSKLVEYERSDDDKMHISYINSDKFYYDIEVDNDIVNVTLTDSIQWFDTFTFYFKFPIIISIPEGMDIKIYVNGVEKEDILNNLEDSQPHKIIT